MNNQRLYGIKHKERESLHPAKRPTPPPPPPTVTASTTVKTSIGNKAIESTSSNKLLAGYMVHEFKTKGTLLGQKFDPAGAETAERGEIRPVSGNERYKEITSLIMMKSDGGVHLPGVVNPSQLARWIQM
ncbi:hypothetical protein L1987_00734 [Smallanthus sonchifolius]|uniref:Uncharacterized protein n=1 Tax=Smallanthus sonchifolius TaxID=185202 RepID=A0ACB9K352_9ASTR|nr:hypothetical protein L1987_00734 [Smallanthus sonchifolius]